MHLRLIAAAGISLLAAAAWGQDETKAITKGQIATTEGVIGGVITDGINEWAITGPSATDGVLTDYTVPAGGTDHQFSSWWWYRVAGDTAETRLPPPDGEQYLGDFAVLTWADVDGRGLFSATYVISIVSEAPGASLLQSLQIVNLSGGNLDIQVFAYTDMDMEGSAVADSATLLGSSPVSISVTEVSTSTYIGDQAPAYRVEQFPAVRNALNDTVVDNFANTGLPFGPGDYAGGLQWGRVIATGQSDTFTTGNCLDTATQECIGFSGLFEDNFETGDTVNWSSSVP